MQDLAPCLSSPPRARSNPLLALVRIAAILTVTVAIYCAYILRQVPLKDKKRRYPVVLRWSSFWAKAICWILGIKVTSRGSVPSPGSLLAPNHQGYLDIIAIISVLPCFFVSRSDAADWPLIGALIRTSEQILASRKRTKDLASTSGQVEERLACGHSVCIFLEGASTGGDRVLPFFQGLLQPAIDTGTSVVPMALRWHCWQPGVRVSDDIAYWKDHRFVPHLWRLMGLRRMAVEVCFGQPLSTENTDRKRLAREAQGQVLQLYGLEEMSS